MSEEIIEFVKKHPGCRYIDVRNYCENELNWSRGKFLSHWKKAKKRGLLKYGEPPRYFDRDLRLQRILPVTMIDAKTGHAHTGTIYEVTVKGHYYGTFYT
jgi:hypothetical protein